MNVMNIKHLFLAAATLGVFAACSDYDPGMSEKVIDYTDEELATIQEYTANFVERYGEIDPNHTWGFGEIGSEDELMQTRIMNVNSNMWAVPNSDFPLSNIPGYPQATDDSQYSGKYFVQKDNDQYQILNTVVAGETGYNPAGDVTDEEIAYVSAWFRTHPNPEPVSVNWDSYYVQAISGDKDREYYGTMTGEGTDAWAEVIDPEQAPTGATAPCGDWVTQTDVIYETTLNSVKTTTPEVKEDILYTVDYLWAPSSSTGPANDHVLNFNWQRTNKIDEKNPTTTFYQHENDKTGNARTITYVYNSNTQHFSVHNSNAEGTNHECVRYDNYVVVNLEFTIGGKYYNGYYVAFDYQFYHDQIPEHSWTDYENNTHTEHKYALRDYDGYYSNYIVKIVPGEGTPVQYPHKWYRIMCEDLGNTYDYDFNDLVYDVYYTGTSGNYTAHIKLQAAGGTYPIYLGSHTREIHEEMGGTQLANGLYQPINVGGMTGSAEEFTIENLTSTNPDNIDINIRTPLTGDSRPNNDFTLPRTNEIQNSAPQKICIPGNTTKWTKENQQIEWAYLHFADWVGNMSGTYRFADWQPAYNNSGTQIGWNLVPASGITPWNTTDVVSSFLYQ